MLGVFELARDLCLAHQASPAVFVAVTVRKQLLECDLALQVFVHGEPHLSKPALAVYSRQRVPRSRFGLEIDRFDETDVAGSGGRLVPFRDGRLLRREGLAEFRGRLIHRRAEHVLIDGDIAGSCGRHIQRCAERILADRADGVSHLGIGNGVQCPRHVATVFSQLPRDREVEIRLLLRRDPAELEQRVPNRLILPPPAPVARLGELRGCDLSTLDRQRGE